MLIIAVSAPIVSVIWPNLAVVAGAVAGAWIFVGRTSLVRFEQSGVERAAAVQELFDQCVFDMPTSGDRTVLPSLEEIALLAGPGADILRKSDGQKLRDWYPVDKAQSGSITIAICQRANASYSDRLLKTTARVWMVGMTMWAVALVAAAFALHLPTSRFLMGILLPLLPAYLDVWEYWRGIRRAAVDRRDLVTTIEQRIGGKSGGIDPQDLLVWQDRLFDLRRNAPQVPNVIYWLSRKRNELAMKTAADQLSKKAKEK